jgi:hypothetical protein
MVRDFFDDLPSYAADGNVAQLIGGITSWDDWNGNEKNDVLVCDLVTALEADWNPYTYAPGDSRYEQWRDRWGNRLRICLRAGLDLATGTGPGVLGLTMGDIRRMYRGRLPEWIATDDWKDGDEGPADLNRLPDEAGILV